MVSVQATAASASASSSLVSQYFIVKISGHALLLRHLISFSRKVNKIITAKSIPILPLLRVSQSLLYFQKRCQHMNNSTRPRLRNTVVFGSGDGIEGLISTKLALYDCSHGAIRWGRLILGYVILLLCSRSGGCKGGGMNAALTYRETVIQIITVSLSIFVLFLRTIR